MKSDPRLEDILFKLTIIIAVIIALYLWSPQVRTLVSWLLFWPAGG